MAPRACTAEELARGTRPLGRLARGSSLSRGSRSRDGGRAGDRENRDTGALARRLATYLVDRGDRVVRRLCAGGVRPLVRSLGVSLDSVRARGAHPGRAARDSALSVHRCRRVHRLRRLFSPIRPGGERLWPLWTGLSRVVVHAGNPEFVFRLLAFSSVLAITLMASTLTIRRKALAIAFVGWNPVLAFHFSSGGHNDALMTALVIGALALAAAGHAEAAGAAWITSFFVKWTSGSIFLLWALDRRKRGDRIGVIGAFAAVLAILAVSYSLFGWSWLDAFTSLRWVERQPGSFFLAWIRNTGISYPHERQLANTAEVVVFAAFAIQALRSRLHLGLAAGTLALVAAKINAWYLIPGRRTGRGRRRRPLGEGARDRPVRRHVLRCARRAPRLAHLDPPIRFSGGGRGPGLTGGHGFRARPCRPPKRTRAWPAAALRRAAAALARSRNPRSRRLGSDGRDRADLVPQRARVLPRRATPPGTTRAPGRSPTAGSRTARSATAFRS